MPINSLLKAAIIGKLVIVGKLCHFVVLCNLLISQRSNSNIFTSDK